MTIETLLSELMEAVTDLTTALRGQGSTSTASAATGKTAPKTPEKKAEATPADDSVEQELATRRQYVFFKDTKTGTIIEKGEPIPTHDGATGRRKDTFEKLAEKHGFDPETGRPLTAESVDEDDLDDDAGTADADDLNGDDLDESPTRDEVRAKLVEYMKAMKGDREVGLKLLKKFGASSTSDLDPKKYQAVYDAAQQKINEAKGEEDLGDI